MTLHTNENNMAILEATPTIETSAYDIDDLIGEKIEFSDALPRTRDSGIIQSVIITDLAKQNAVMDVAFFTADPGNTTFTDNEALAIDDADLVNLIGVAKVADWISFNDNSRGQAFNLPGMPFVLVAGTSLFAALISRIAILFSLV